MKKGKTLKIVAPVVTAILLAFAITATIVINLPLVRYAINDYVIGWKPLPVTEESVALAAEGDDLAEYILMEGAVLMKNEGNLLPLKRSQVKKLNVFGWSSAAWVPSGSGSGRTNMPVAALALENPEAPYTGRPRWSNYVANNLYAEIDIYGALMKYGIDYNTDLKNFYLGFNGTANSTTLTQIAHRPHFTNGTLSRYDFQYSRLVEPKIDQYTPGLLDGTKSYSDYAIVVISRVSGESNDSPKVQYKGNHTVATPPSILPADDATRHYLEISTEEEALLTHVGANFPGKTIVLINSTNTMELGFMDKIPGLAACLNVGTTGPRGATGIPKLLFDEVKYLKVKEGMTTAPNGPDKWEEVVEKGFVPSGRTVDTYAYDLKTNPTWASIGHPANSNFGLVAPDGSGMKFYDLQGNDVMPNVTHSTNNNSRLYPLGRTSGNYPGSPQYSGLAYIDYMESIYVDYKWYETADKMGYWTAARLTNKTPTGRTGYNGIVQYPFGYGLSYTTFTQSIYSYGIIRGGVELSNPALQKGDKIQVRVQVNNTGNFPGKEVVQIYYDPPYTSGGVEKASANLVAFAKTQIIQPGKSELVTLEFDIYDMASYDCYNKSGKVGASGGYILESGTYAVKVMNNSHLQANGMTMAAATLNYTLDTAIVYGEDPVTGAKVENRFTGAASKIPNVGDGVSVDGSEESTPVKYLSRTNFTETFPTVQVQRTLTPDVRALNRYTHNSDKAFAWNAANQPATPVTVGAADNGMRLSTGSTSNSNDPQAVPTELALELGKAENYNDARWNQLLSQMSLADMQTMVRQSGVNTQRIASIGFPQNPMRDGPNQWGGWNSVGRTGFPSATTLAQTYNVQLAYKMGLRVGNDAIASSYNHGAWLAPGINIHRSPLGSRNYEYYSADPVMSGKMAAMAIRGILNKGVYVYIKHLALYDQDNNRDSLYTWLIEQALREVYLKPFRTAIQEGNATGIMTAYNRIGANWTGGSHPLQQGVIRDEMGFKGSILSDWIDRPDYMDISHKIRTGGDIAMAAGNFTGWENTSDEAFRAALRRSNKNIAWTWANAKYTASIYDSKNDPLNESTVVIPIGNLETNFDWIAFIIIPLLYLLAIGGGGTWIFFAYKSEILGSRKKSETD